MGVAIDVIRLIVMLVGFTLCLACFKFAWLAWKAREGWRAWGLMSYALLVVTPAVTALYQLGEPPIWPALVTYAASLVCGVVALRFAYTINPEWGRMRRREKADA